AVPMVRSVPAAFVYWLPRRSASAPLRGSQYGGRSSRSAVDADGAIGQFAQDVGVADVPGGFLDHVRVDPTQRYPTQSSVWYGVVQWQAGRDPPGLGACLVVVRDQLVDRLIRIDLEAAVAGIGVGADLLRAAPAQHALEPFALDRGQVLDQPGQGGAGGHDPAPGVRIGQAADLAAQ